MSFEYRKADKRYYMAHVDQITKQLDRQKIITISTQLITMYEWTYNK